MKKILVIRVGRAGDMVMITPSLRAILDHFPDHELHVLTSQDGKRVLSGFDSRVTALIEYKKKRLTTLFARFRQQSDIAKMGYEYIFNFELKPIYKKLYKNLGAKAFELDKGGPELNYAKRCLNIVQKAIDYPIPNYWDWLPVTEEGVEKAKKQLMEAGISDDDFVIGVHPSFSGSKNHILSNKKKEYLREWPPDYYASLARLIFKYAKQNNLNIKIIMDLLPEERELGESIVEQSGGVILLFTAPPNFERYKATIKRMNLLITPNTGPMHIAAAVKTNIVALFVDWDPADCGPYMENNLYEVLRAEDFKNNKVRLTAIKPENVLVACKKFMPATSS